MCDTKMKIAAGLKELLYEKPIHKITVQDIMERKHMKRQSFYYHFQDIYDVIAWICEEELFQDITYEKEESFEEWMLRVVQTLNEDPVFYKKVLEDMDAKRIILSVYPIIECQVVNRLYYEGEERKMVVEFLTSSICHALFDNYTSKGRLEEEKMTVLAHYISGLLKLGSNTMWMLTA